MSSRTAATTEPTPRMQKRSLATRDKILDAAIDLYRAGGFSDTSISEIIKQSGVGRTTFYRHFRDQNEVLNMAIIRDFEQLIADFESQRFAHDDPAVQIVEDVCWFNRQLRSRPAISLLFGEERERLYSKLNISLETFERLGLSSSESTFELARERGILREGIDLNKYVDWCTFIILSLQTTQQAFAANEFLLRDMLRDFLVPGLFKTEPA